MTPSREDPIDSRHGAQLLSPATLLLMALLLVIACGVAGLLTPREDVSLLTATTFAPDAADGNRTLWAGVYAVLYFAAVLLAPILAVASVIFWALLRVLSRRGPVAGAKQQPR
jgi:hypothetical protein